VCGSKFYQRVKMISNVYIENLFTHIKGFKGVYSSNNIGKLSRSGECLIINFDKAGESGSHFVCLYMKSKNHCLYFDSLNLPIIPFEIYKYLSNQSFHITNSSQNIQSFDSVYCGFYCMLFIICNKIGFEYWKKISKKFKQRCMSNDSKCISFLCTTLKKYFQ